MKATGRVTSRPHRRKPRPRFQVIFTVDRRTGTPGLLRINDNNASLNRWWCINDEPRRLSLKRILWGEKRHQLRHHVNQVLYLSFGNALKKKKEEACGSGWSEWFCMDVYCHLVSWCRTDPAKPESERTQVNKKQKKQKNTIHVRFDLKQELNGAERTEVRDEESFCAGAQLQRSVLQHVAKAPGVVMKPWHTAMFMHWRNE